MPFSPPSRMNTCDVVVPLLPDFMPIQIEKKGVQAGLRIPGARKFAVEKDAIDVHGDWRALPFVAWSKIYDRFPLPQDDMRDTVNESTVESDVEVRYTMRWGRLARKLFPKRNHIKAVITKRSDDRVIQIRNEGRGKKTE